MPSTDPIITPEQRTEWLCPLPLGRAELRQAILECADRGDPWGSVMGALFPIAAELHFRDPDLVPAEWHFHPGAFSWDDPREPEDYLTPACAVASTDALEHVGKVFHRAAAILKAQGRDY